MNNPLLSIIIVSFNTADITIDCLKSIIADKGLKDIPYEIVIIDNDSICRCPMLTPNATSIIENSLI